MSEGRKVNASGRADRYRLLVRKRLAGVGSSEPILGVYHSMQGSLWSKTISRRLRLRPSALQSVHYDSSAEAEETRLLKTAG
jgi:hypothetical protein